MNKGYKQPKLYLHIPARNLENLSKAEFKKQYQNNDVVYWSEEGFDIRFEMTSSELIDLIG